MYLSNFLCLIPEIFLIISSMVLLLLGIVVNKKLVNIAAIFCLMVTILLSLFSSQLEPLLAFDSLLRLDFYTYVAKIIVLGSAFILLIMFFVSKYNYRYEFVVVMLFAIFGMLTLISANNLLSFYLSFEIQSIALYILACFDKTSSRSSEAGIKYFILGALSSCIMLYGISVVYGYTGKAGFVELTQFFSAHEKLSPGVLLGMVLILISICFKLSAAPFHMWVPDVYQGTSTIVTAFFSVLPKATFMLLLVRLLNEVFINSIQHWQQILLCVSVLSAFISAFGALNQNNLKRLFAYGSIGHVGYMCAAAALGNNEGIQAILIYLILYITMNIGLFAFLVRLQDDDCNISSITNLRDRFPLAAFCISVLMLSMAGIPPIAGFFAKFYVLSSLIRQHFIVISLLFVLSSAISCYYYLRVIKVMYFDRARFQQDEVIIPRNTVLDLILTVMTLVNILFFLFAEKIHAALNYLIHFYFFK